MLAMMCLVAVSGRIVQKRQASKKLVFYDLESSYGSLISPRPFVMHCCGFIGRLQVLSSQARFEGDFSMHQLLKRGDIIGTSVLPEPS